MSKATANKDARSKTKANEGAKVCKPSMHSLVNTVFNIIRRSKITNLFVLKTSYMFPYTILDPWFPQVRVEEKVTLRALDDRSKVEEQAKHEEREEAQDAGAACRGGGGVFRGGGGFDSRTEGVVPGAVIMTEEAVGYQVDTPSPRVIGSCSGYIYIYPLPSCDW